MAQLAGKTSGINISGEMLRAGQLLAVPLLVFILTAGNSKAQIPGHWEQAYTLSGWRFDNIIFSDTNHGIVFADSNAGYSGHQTTATAIIRTSDGGASWHFITLYNGPSVTAGSSYWDYVNSGKSTMLDSLNAYIYGDYWLLATHDGGLRWEIDTNAFPQTSGGWFIRMFTPDMGRAISNEFIYTFATTDSGRHFDPIGNAPGGFYDAIFLDTSEYWISNRAPNGFVASIMDHTTDAGNNDDWTSDTIVDSIPEYYSLTSITQTPDRARFYVLFRWGEQLAPTRFHLDFVETTDDGASWRIDSTLDSAVIYELSAPAPNQLWALLYPIYETANGYTYYPSTVGANSVSYSPDDGHTWYMDSTLLGDTLTGMFWPDAQHGFVTASKNHSLVIYRFVSNPPSGVLPVKQAIAPVSIFPNPAIRSCTISSGTPGARIELFDVLGREVLSGTVPATGSLTLDVSTLPRGIYEVMLDQDARNIPVGKLAVQ